MFRKAKLASGLAHAAACGSERWFRSKHRGLTIFGRPLLCIGRAGADNKDDDDGDGGVGDGEEVVDNRDNDLWRKKGWQNCPAAKIAQELLGGREDYFFRALKLFLIWDEIISALGWDYFCLGNDILLLRPFFF